MVRDYVEEYYAPAAQSLRKTIAPAEGVDSGAFGAARELAAYRRRVESAWPGVTVTDVDSTGLPDTPLLGSKLTLTATVQLAGLAPEEVTVQAVMGRVDSSDYLLDPVTIDMAYTGMAGGESHVFSATTPLPLAGPVGYTVRVLPHHPLLAGGTEIGLVAPAR
jgi:starch phosphorylase